MSRQYNPAIVAYKNMDIENMPKEKVDNSGSGLLKRKLIGNNLNLDQRNPVYRAAKQLQVIRKYREEI